MKSMIRRTRALRISVNLLAISLLISATNAFAMAAGSSAPSESSLPLVPIAANEEGVFSLNNSIQGFFSFDKSPQVRVRPSISAASFMVIDPHTASEIISHNPHLPLPPASLTKIMTAYIVAEKLREAEIGLQDEVPISTNAMQTPGSRMYIQTDRIVTLDQLLFGLIVSSGNDAAVAIAEYISGSEEEFVTLMNRYTQSLGMLNCFFTNSHGLDDPKMLCSINDMMILCRELLINHPAFYDRYFAVREFTYNGISQRNRNRLLFFATDEIDGIKTGNTDDAGYNLIASGVREYRLVAGVMGSRSIEARTTEVSKLLNHAYVYYNRYLHYHNNEEIYQLRIRRGKERSVSVGLEEDLYSTLPYTLQDAFTVVAEVPDIIRAPIARGQKLGEIVIVFKDSAEVIRRPLIALQNIEESGAFASFIDELLLWLGF